jgi:hypothetical protein
VRVPTGSFDSGAINICISILSTTITPSDSLKTREGGENRYCFYSLRRRKFVERTESSLSVDSLDPRPSPVRLYVPRVEIGSYGTLVQKSCRSLRAFPCVRPRKTTRRLLLTKFCRRSRTQKLAFVLHSTNAHHAQDCEAVALRKRMSQDKRKKSRDEQ